MHSPPIPLPTQSQNPIGIEFLGGVTKLLQSSLPFSQTNDLAELKKLLSLLKNSTVTAVLRKIPESSVENPY